MTRTTARNYWRAQRGPAYFRADPAATGRERTAYSLGSGVVQIDGVTVGTVTSAIPNTPEGLRRMLELYGLAEPQPYQIKTLAALLGRRK